MAYNQPPQSALMQLAQGAQAGINNYSQQQALGMDDFTRQLMSYDPQLALQYQSGTLNKRASVLAEQEQQRLLQKEQQQQSALVALNKEISAGRMDKQSALAALSEITGDPQYISSIYDASASGGGTGVLAEKLMAENPGMTLKQALEYINKGSRIGTGYIDEIEAAEEAKARGATTGDLNAQRELKPGVEAAVSEAGVVGKETGETKVALANYNAYLPKIQETVSLLSDLAKTATYSKAGQLWADGQRQLGREVSPADINRAAYIAVVDNEVLPLLRQTFGAAFTVAEGDSLRATLGDPDASPAEKQAKLDAFMRNKIEQIKAEESKLNILTGGQGAAVTNAPTQAVREVDFGSLK